MDTKNVFKTLGKMNKCEFINDFDLNEAITFLTGIVYFLELLGERYFFVRKEIGSKLEVLENFLNARAYLPEEKQNSEVVSLSDEENRKLKAEIFSLKTELQKKIKENSDLSWEVSYLSNREKN